MKKIFFVLLLLSGKLFANTITVSSIAELQSAIDKAKPGDKIVVKDGVYTTTADINIACVGTKEHPITITSQNFGKAEITAAGGFNLISPSSYVVIRDFKFTHAASKAKSSSGSVKPTREISETSSTSLETLELVYDILGSQGKKIFFFSSESFGKEIENEKHT